MLGTLSTTRAAEYGGLLLPPSGSASWSCLVATCFLTKVLRLPQPAHPPSLVSSTPPSTPLPSSLSRRSYYNHVGNVLYKASIQFNGGTQIYPRGNLIIQKQGWHLGPTPDAAGAFNNTFVDTNGEEFTGACDGFITGRGTQGHGNYTGDFNVGVYNSTGDGQGGGIKFCGMDLGEWQSKSGQDLHSRTAISTSPDDEYSAKSILAKARRMMYALE